METEIRDSIYTIIMMLARRDPRSNPRQAGPDPTRVLNENVQVLLNADETDEFVTGVLRSLRGARGLDPKIESELKERFGEA